MPTANRVGVLKLKLLSVHETSFSPPKRQHAPHPQQVPAGYAEALANVDFDEIQDDIKRLLLESKPEWPADYGHYGPFFIRLAWHCSGS